VVEKKKRQRNILSIVKSKKAIALGRNMLCDRSVLSPVWECLDSHWSVVHWQLHIKPSADQQEVEEDQNS